jgi:hypothetical protein
MKKVLLVLILCGCSAKRTEIGNNAKEPEKSHIRNDSELVDKTEFLNLFKEVSFDTLHIFFEHNSEGEVAIKGVKVPKKILTYFPEEVRLGATEWNVSPVYACYKFQYTPEVTALIANVPSQYDATAFDIYLFSEKKDKIIFSQRIAENTGDAGYSITQDSWLIDLNKDGIMDLVTKQLETIPEDEELEKFSYSDSTLVYLGEKSSFKNVMPRVYNTKRLKVHKTNI